MSTDVTRREGKLGPLGRLGAVVMGVVCICWLAAVLLPFAIHWHCGVAGIGALISTIGISGKTALVIAVIWWFAELIYWVSRPGPSQPGDWMFGPILMVLFPLGGVSLLVNTLTSAEMPAHPWERPAAFLVTGALAVFGWIYFHTKTNFYSYSGVDACINTLTVIALHVPACLAVEYFICRVWLRIY